MKRCPYCNYELNGRLSGQVVKINNHTDILPLVSEIRHRTQEHFIMITLDAAHLVIEKRVLFIGTLNESLVHPREVFAPAIEDRAASIILVHNHTSLSIKPSAADICVTERIVECGDLLGIKVLDHIIIAPNGDYSMEKHGYIREAENDNWK